MIIDSVFSKQAQRDHQARRMSPDEFDIIIVGAGSAGCVLAERLSADRACRVLLIEAGGPDRSPFIHMPKGLVKLLGDARYVWTYPVEPGVDGATPAEFWVRGKTLGGSSSINGMMYTAGLPVDYDRLAELGCTGWTWEAMAPYLRGQERHALGKDGYRGNAGPLHVSMPEPNPFCDAVIAAGPSVGIESVADINAPAKGGVIGYFPRTIRHGRRWSAARAFLPRRGDRPNLTIRTGQIVEKILIERGRAVGVRCTNGQVMRATQQVVLSAGAINSPKILMLSGIGDAQELRAHGIEVIVDSPQVGKNLIEHRVLAMKFRTDPALSRNRDYSGWRLTRNIVRYYTRGKGALAGAAYDAGAFVKADPGSARPDVELLFAPHSIDRIKRPIGLEDAPGVTCTAFVLRPESRGHMALRSALADDPPIIQPNYLTAESDRRISIEAVKFVRRLMAAEPLKSMVRQEIEPGTTRSDDEILDAWRRLGSSGYHLIGSCRMGSDNGAVVSPSLAVNGVSNLRVVDCSILPHMIAGNTNGPIMAIAARAADIIAASLDR